MTASRVFAGFLVGIVTSFWPAAFAGDWPQWGGSDNRNMVSAEKGLPEMFVPGQKKPFKGGIDLTTTKNVKWVARLGSGAYGNPTVAGGRVFVGTDDQTLNEIPGSAPCGGGLVKCLDEATGQLLWQLAVPVRTGFPKEVCYGHQNLGTCSSPIVDGDRVYVVDTADEVVCLDVHGQPKPNAGPPGSNAEKQPVNIPAADPRVLWRYDLIKELKVIPHDAASGSILIHGDVLYVGTSNGVGHSHLKVLSPDAPAFVALDKRTGRLLATEGEKLSTRLFHAQWSSPSLGQVGDKTLIFFGGGDGVCYAFEALTTIPEQPVFLKKVWSYDCNPPNYKFRDGKPIPYIAGDKRRMNSPNKNDGLYVGPSEIIATPVFYHNRVYVAIGEDPAHGRGKGMLHCIDATKTGDITETGRIWTYDGMDRTIATAVIADGLVYIPDIAGRFHCLDADSGKPYWVYETKTETWGGALVADGKIYFGNRMEFLVMATGKEPKVLSRVRLGSPIYSTPIVANGVLYVASQQYLWAVQRQP